MKQQILDYLKNSFGIEGDDAQELFDSYISTLDENIGKFDSLLASGDFIELTRAAHTVKGCAMNSGHEEMAKVALAMEQAGKACDKAQCGSFAAQVKGIFEKLKQS